MSVRYHQRAGYIFLTYLNYVCEYVLQSKYTLESVQCTVYTTEESSKVLSTSRRIFLFFFYLDLIGTCTSLFVDLLRIIYFSSFAYFIQTNLFKTKPKSKSHQLTN